MVAIVAVYEACVKETLVGFAARHHSNFGQYAERQYERLNSKIRLEDLYAYCRVYDSRVHDKFGRIIKHRKKRVIDLTGRDFSRDYNQIINWRHAFAHAGKKVTTVEEALRTHSYAKFMLHAFDDAFS